MQTLRRLTAAFVLLAAGCSSRHPAPQNGDDTPAAAAFVDPNAVGSGPHAGGCDPAAPPVSSATSDAPRPAPVADGGAPDVFDAALDAQPDVISGASPLLKPRVFAYGNSLVFGSNLPAATIATDRFPAQLAARLGDAWQSDLWVGRGGWPTSMLITAAPHDLAAANAETNRARKVLVFWEGVNEMGSPFNCEAYEIMTRRRIAEGWSVVLITATPTITTADFGPDGGAPDTSRVYWSGLRHAFNQCVVDHAPSWGAAAVVDVEAIAELANPWDANTYLDGVHLTPYGYGLVADATAPKVQALYVAPVP